MLWKSIRPPRVPESCHSCRVRGQTVCGALYDKRLTVLRKLKRADRVLPAGSQLYRPGENCGELYTLQDGWIGLYRILPSGRRQILDFALPGQFFGYQENLTTAMLHGAECLTDVSVCVYSRRDFLRQLDSRPELAVRLTAIAARDIARLHDHITNVGARSARGRIANLLMELCGRLGRHDVHGRGQIFDIPLAQHDLADALGLSSVYVSQTLKLLREQRVLVFRNGRLQILSPVALAELADIESSLVA